MAINRDSIVIHFRNFFDLLYNQPGMAEAIFAIEREHFAGDLCFDEPEWWIEHLRANHVCVLAFHESRLIGYFIVEYIHDTAPGGYMLVDAEVGSSVLAKDVTIAVAADYAGQGVATLLWEAWHSYQIAREPCVAVFQTYSLPMSLAFEKWGMKRTHTTYDLYEDAREAWQYQLAIGCSAAVVPVLIDKPEDYFLASGESALHSAAQALVALRVFPNTYGFLLIGATPTPNIFEKEAARQGRLVKVSWASSLTESVVPSAFVKQGGYPSRKDVVVDMNLKRTSMIPHYLRLGRNLYFEDRSGVDEDITLHWAEEVLPYGYAADTLDALHTVHGVGVKVYPEVVSGVHVHGDYNIISESHPRMTGGFLCDEVYNAQALDILFSLGGWDWITVTRNDRVLAQFPLPLPVLTDEHPWANFLRPWPQTSGIWQWFAHSFADLLEAFEVVSSCLTDLDYPEGHEIDLKHIWPDEEVVALYGKTPYLYRENPSPLILPAEHFDVDDPSKETPQRGVHYTAYHGGKTRGRWRKYQRMHAEMGLHYGPPDASLRDPIIVKLLRDTFVRGENGDPPSPFWWFEINYLLLVAIQDADPTHQTLKSFRILDSEGNVWGIDIWVRIPTTEVWERAWFGYPHEDLSMRPGWFFGWGTSLALHREGVKALSQGADSLETVEAEDYPSSYKARFAAHTIPSVSLNSNTEWGLPEDTLTVEPIK